jgi:hypothetical protein
VHAHGGQLAMALRVLSCLTTGNGLLGGHWSCLAVFFGAPVV